MSNVGSDGKPRWWTAPEDRLLRELYPTQGPAACAAALPGRTMAAIYQRAITIGLKAPRESRRGQPRLRWENTPEIDAILRAEVPACTTSGAMSALAARLGRPRHWLHTRAAALGLVAPRFDAQPWTAEEIALMQRLATLTPTGISRALRRAGYRRSPAAVVVKLHRLDLDNSDPDSHTARDLGLLLGVDGNTVVRWINCHGLPAARRHADTGAGATSHWRIQRRNFRLWLRDHPTLVDLRKVDRLWFIDLCLGGK